MTVGEEGQDNVLRVSTQRNAGFYIRAATNFLQGVTGKDGVEKKVYDSIIVSALGGAIPSAAAVTGKLEQREVATVTKIETGYTDLEWGKRPHIQITLQRNPDYVPPPPTEKPGKKGGALQEPETPERLKGDKLEKKMKKVLKEGGKRGVEIEGAADMGGLKYFCTKVLEPAGDVEMLVESVKAMNAKSDPTEEERKGGSGRVGKVVQSMGDDNNLCVVAYVPPEETHHNDAQVWLKHVIKMVGGGEYAIAEGSNINYAWVCIQNDGEKDIFCIKMRDYIIQHANGYLRSKDLIPEDDSDSDEMVFGDDDFDM